MKTPMKVLALCLLLLSLHPVFSQDIGKMDREAQKFLANREYNRAISLWLQILDIDPEHESSQRMIEYVYEIKQKKDLALQRSKLNLRIARRIINKNFTDEDISEQESRHNLSLTLKRADIAFRNYETALKIDSRDPEVLELLDDMKRLEALINAERDRQRVALALKIRHRKLVKLGRKLMQDEKFPEALKVWNDILSFLPKDKIAQDEKRRATLAIENRLKYERIKKFIAQGKELYKTKKYHKSKLQFDQALTLDKWNMDARRYLDLIKDRLDAKKRYEQNLKQAEEMYIAGLKDIKAFQFDKARENFESILALFNNKDYKDTRARLASLEKLKKEYLKREREKKARRIEDELNNGIFAFSRGKYKDAVSSFEIVLRLDPENELAKDSIHKSKLALKQEREEKVDRNSPYYNIVKALIVSGRNLYDQGHFRESKEKWDRILELFPKNRIAREYIIRCNLKLNPGSFDRFARAQIIKGKEMMRKKNYQDALRIFELITSVSKNYPGIKRLIAQARRLGTRNIIAGGNTGGKRINATPAQVRARYRRALVYYQRGGEANLKKALVDFRWVVRADPGNIKAIVSVSKIESQIRLGTGGGGRTTGRAGLTPAQRAKVRKYYYSGISYYSNNNFKAALREWRKVLAINPGHVKAKNNIRKVLELMSR